MIQVSRHCTAASASTSCCGGGGDDASLSSLIHDFLVVEWSDRTDGTHDDGNDVDDAASPAGASGDGDHMQRKDDASAMGDKAMKTAQRITALLRNGMANDPVRLQLTDDVARAVDEMAALRANRPAFRPALACRLREFGYDAGICHARWRGTSDVAAGDYKYIDVVVTAATGKATGPGERYIVDVGFVAEFAVARPTVEYALVLDVLPRVLVGRPKVVKQVVKLAAKAARRSLKSQGLTVPPWRKKRFMVAKWLGPHRRTANAVTVTRSSVVAGAGEATCRSVGFVLGPQLEPSLSCAL